MNTNEQSPVFYCKGDDPQLRAATKLARDTFGFFWRELSWEYRRIIPGLDVACVKAPFSDSPNIHEAEPDGIEQMWVSDVRFDGREIRGTLINAPNFLKSVSDGDEVTVPLSQLSDWMYAIEGTAYGAHSVNVIRSQMSAGDRKQHDGAWGLDFGSPDGLRLVPANFLGEEEEAPKKKGFFGSLFGGGDAAAEPKRQSVEQVASVEHPMAVNMAPSLEEMLLKEPENATKLNEDGFSFLHQMALAGTAVGTEVVLKNGGDPNAPTGHGMTPIDLANSLKWSNVVDVLRKHGAK